MFTLSWVSASTISDSLYPWIEETTKQTEKNETNNMANTNRQKHLLGSSTLSKTTTLTKKRKRKTHFSKSEKIVSSFFFYGSSMTRKSSKQKLDEKCFFRCHNQHTHIYPPPVLMFFIKDPFRSFFRFFHPWCADLFSFVFLSFFHPWCEDLFSFVFLSFFFIPDVRSF